MVALRTGQRTATDAIQEATRAAGGEFRRLLRSSAPGKRPSLAPASQLEGSATMSTSARRSLPARFASPDPLPHASDSPVDCSLHRSMSTAEFATYRSKMVQIPPMVAGAEATAADAPAGGCGGAKGGPIDEGRRAGRPQPPPGGCQPPPGHRGRREAQGRRRAGLPAPTGGVGGESRAGRAAGDEGAATSVSARCASEPTFVHVECTCVMYTNVVSDGSQPPI